MMERWKTETFPDVTWTSNSSTHSAGVLATQLMLLAALPPPSPFPEPLASGHTPVVARQQSLLPPTGPVLADPVALRNHETHAILECLLFPPISLFFAPLKLAWAAAFSFPQTPPTLARASSLPSLVLGPSAKEFRGCATAPVPAQRQNRSPAPPISSQSLVSAAPCVPTLETRSSPLASPLRPPEHRTDLVYRLFERGPFWNKQHLPWKESGRNPCFFPIQGRCARSRLSVNPAPAAAGRFDLSSPSQHLHLRPTAPPIAQSASLSASTTAASRIDTALQQQPHWPPIPRRFPRCGRPLTSYFNSSFCTDNKITARDLFPPALLPRCPGFRRKTLHRRFLLHELLIR